MHAYIHFIWRLFFNLDFLHFTPVLQKRQRILHAFPSSGSASGWTTLINMDWVRVYHITPTTSTPLFTWWMFGNIFFVKLSYSFSLIK